MGAFDDWTCVVFGHDFGPDYYWDEEHGWVSPCVHCGRAVDPWYVRMLSRARVEVACLLALASIWWRWLTVPCETCGERRCRNEDCNLPF